jgi:chromatin remodeling complex protein RSC6
MPTPSKKQPVSTLVTPIVAVTPETSVADAQSKKKKSVAASSQVPQVLPVTVREPATITASDASTVSAATTATTVAAVVPPVVEAPADNVLSNIIDKVNSLSAYIKDIQANLKVLSKEYDKQQKIIEKAQKKRQNAKNSPSGFAKPNKISDELCDFIGVPHGTEKSRTDITRLINAYVKEHNLNKPENKRFILPDAKLKKILNVGDSEEINYFILQKLISHHFPASASKTAAKTTV